MNQQLQLNSVRSNLKMMGPRSVGTNVDRLIKTLQAQKHTQFFGIIYNPSVLTRTFCYNKKHEIMDITAAQAKASNISR